MACNILYADIKELVERLRRVETRLTSYINKTGVTINYKKPSWDADNTRVIIPSREVALDEILAAIPDEFRDVTIPVLFAGNEYCGVMK
jgi:hypothetical protein